MQIGVVAGESPELAQADQGGCGVAGSTGQSGTDRDALDQLQIRARELRGPLASSPVSQGLGGPQNEIVIANAQVGAIAAQLDRRIGAGADAQLIGQIEALHHHGQLVEAVGSQPQHLQVQVDLGGRQHAQLRRVSGCLLLGGCDPELARRQGFRLESWLWRWLGRGCGRAQA
jgi:hypothetical protein